MLNTINLEKSGNQWYELHVYPSRMSFETH